MKLYLTEKQMEDVDNMIAQGLSVNLIINKIFADTPRCMEGVWERIEDMFLSGLSSGVALSTRNNGTGIRVSYGYKGENQFGVAALWSGADAKVMDDIKHVTGVVYQTADDFILLSKYAKNDPLQEFTSSQAMVVPVIDNVDRIYCLDSKTVQA